MEATDKTREIVPLYYIKENESIIMLGIYLAPDVNNKYQVKYMHKNTTAWATYIILGGVEQN